ncbi:FecR family protein [Pedobacter immunditicola]|uniref:FecR family protein n=1 Tax=Pedobacter immunditicola TaxID=3133440 RepID=UPI0030B2BF56
MGKYTDSENLIKDFINDRLTDHDREKFLKLYYSITQGDREEADSIFDDIHAQIEALSNEELAFFLNKLDVLNSKAKTSKTSKSLQIFSYLSYAAIIVAVLSVGFLFFKSFEKGPASYFAKTDQLIWLPDSSSVVLKAGSSLYLAASYGRSVRQTKLDGEGFFDVKPNKQKPFIVHSKHGLVTKVLGTSFLMSTKNTLQKVEVKTGKVQVSNGDKVYAILLAGDKIIKRGNDAVEIKRQARKTPDENIEFNNLDLRIVASKLMEIYGRSIVIDKSVPEGLKYTATFSSNQPLEEIIMTISTVHHLHYKISSEKIIVFK